MASENVDNTEYLEYQGWLYKWTNYLKRYRRRWFVLKDGKLSYYTSQEPGKKSRDTINLVNSVIMLDEPLNIVISDNEKRTLHLRCSTELERQKWLTSLELSKSRAIKKEDLEEEELQKTSLMSSSAVNYAKVELQTFLQNMKAALKDMIENSENVSRIAATLPDDMYQMSPRNFAAEMKTLDAIRPRLHYLHCCTDDLVASSTNFLEFARSEHRWRNQMLMDRERRENLERTLENLAREHSDLHEMAMELYACCYKEHTLTDSISESPEYIIRNMKGRVSSLSTISRSTSKSYDYSSSDAESVIEMDEAFRQETKILTTMVNLEEQGGKLQEGYKETKAVLQGLISSQDLVALAGTCHTCDESVFKPAASTSSTNKYSSFQEDTRLEKHPTIIKDTVPEFMPALSVEGHEFPLKRVRRTTVPERPVNNPSACSLLMNCIGRDMTTTSMPVALSEPLSWLQRLTEEYEYSELLDKAALCDDSCEQMVYISAYAVSSVCTTSLRTGKPFNPLLGETFECDRSEDFGWRCISEQVSHHPPVASQHCEGRGWKCWQEFSTNMTFLGQYLKLTPFGIIHLEFSLSGHHYTWREGPTILHNLIVGTIVVQNRGNMTIANHTTGEKSFLKFHSHQHLSCKKSRNRVTGAVLNKEGDVTWVLKGAWDSYIEAKKVIEGGESRESKHMLTTSDAQLFWKRRISPEECKEMYYFSTFTCQLNEPEPDVAPTDSRRRPDIRCMENGDFDAAAELKNQLEDKQRSARRKLEKEAETAAGRPFSAYKPAWFKMQKDPITGYPIFIYAGEYWKCKERQDWRKCPDIFL